MKPPLIKTASGFALWALNKVGADGWASNWNTIYVHPAAKNRAQVIAHELAHIDQIRRDGRWGMPLKYALQMLSKYRECRNSYMFLHQSGFTRIKNQIRWAYWHCPYEVEARRKAGQE